MKISCLQDNLAKGLSIVGRAVASRSTLPVLSNVMLATDNGRLKLSATNLELGINCWVGAKVEEDVALCSEEEEDRIGFWNFVILLVKFQNSHIPNGIFVNVL